MNKEGSKFCKNCGKPLVDDNLNSSDKVGSQNSKEFVPNIKKANVSSDGSKVNKNTLIVCISVIICILIVVGAFVFINLNNSNNSNGEVNVNNQSDVASVSNEVNSEPVTQKSWHLVDSYSGSGSGSENHTLPAGEVKVKISAYPIKNYATNYLSVSTSSGRYDCVEWGPKSAVATRSDSMTLNSNYDSFSITYYETVSWNVDVYKYY